MRTWTRWAALAALLAGFASCAKEEITADTEERTAPRKEAFVIQAGFEDGESLRSRIALNEGGSRAKVLWTAGDRILLAARKGSTYYTNAFTTSDNGTTRADFACDDYRVGEGIERWYGFYPGKFGASLVHLTPTEVAPYLPTNQEAVAGGFGEGLNLALATTDDITGGLRFRNLPALVKFRMSGSAVSSLSKVRLVGTTVLAGGVLLTDLDAENPVIHTNSWYTYQGTGGERPSQEVTLTGPFQPDTDYYFVVYPGTTDGFSMLFIYEDGHYTVKQSAKTVTLNRSRITDFGTISLNGATFDQNLSRWAARTHEGGKPVVICVVAEGFTASQRDRFESLADHGLEALFSTEPYKSYKEYFTVYKIWTPSPEEGASVVDADGNYVRQVNTAFGARWEADAYDQMVADGPRVYAFVTAHCPEIIAGTHSIDEVPVALVVNDKRYGGKAISSSSGRSYSIVPWTYGGDEITWSLPDNIPNSDAPMNGSYSAHRRTQAELDEVGGRNAGDWRNTFVHEFGGHGFGRLGDEYWKGSYTPAQAAVTEHSWPVPFSLNISGYYDDVPWQGLLDRQESLAGDDPHYGRIGKFQGAGLSLYNRWRSERISCMIDNRFYFSAWQRMLIVKRILGLCGETFDESAFFAKDVTTDPVRDGGKTAPASVRGPLRLMPPLPAPELIDNTSGEIRLGAD